MSRRTFEQNLAAVRGAMQRTQQIGGTAATKSQVGYLANLITRGGHDPADLGLTGDDALLSMEDATALITKLKPKG